ncbi:MAG: hypothetical protein JWN85_2364 [Gammaproteobacteria bacterium]|nr:hypothetical protein [Gammaproteobacteria bacterium]
MLSEFRDAGGALGAFELSHEYTSLGALVTALAHFPGIRFEDAQSSLWAGHPSRFTFQNRLYEISIPFMDLRIAPAEPGAAYPETEALLRLMTDNLITRWQHRGPARVFRT